MDHCKVSYKVKHAGGTVIGRDVHIGDQVTVANALFEGAVTIGDHCMIDNFWLYRPQLCGRAQLYF